MPIILETERMLLREFQPKDAPFLFQLNSDPEVLKYTGDIPFSSINAVESFIETYQENYKHKMGRLACIQKEDDAFLGWCGLRIDNNTQVVDLGFRFYKREWRKGFATEAAITCLHYGFGQLDLNEIIGRAQDENIASLRVLQKIGMHYVGKFEFDLHPGVLYKISKSNFFQQQKLQ